MRSVENSVSRLSFSLPSFAKINLSLRILGKRPDGYHELRTILQTISLCDQLFFESTSDDSIVLSCNDSELPLDEQNLVLRSANLLKHEMSVSDGCRIHLEKRIPMEAGLGGGSSNAAVTLLGLARLWQLKTMSDDLRGVAAKLGADVPFFLSGGCALGTGTGETISQLQDPPKKHLVLIKPNAQVSTKMAYQAFDSVALTSTVPETILAVSRDEADFDDSNPWRLDNDFEKVIFDIEPEIARARAALLNAGARKVMLAGSGSSVFGIFDDLDEQVRAAGLIEAEAGWRVFPCVTISRNEYSRALET